jgi:hypothetical protein
MNDKPPLHGLRMAQAGPGLNHVMAYGQSLASGWEGWPALSLQPRGDSLMLGRSVRPEHESAAHWTPIGGPSLHRLAATVQDPSTGLLLAPEDVARLPPGNVALGETVLEAAVHALRTGMTVPDGVLLASSCGTGGRPMEALSRWAEPELFNRLRDCARTARQVATLSGRDYRVLAVLLLQGENNSWGLNGSTADRSAYRALLARFYHALITDIAQGIAGQAAPPALFLYQTGGAYASDELGVAMAQLDLALGLPGCIMVGPSYPVPDKGGHLDANGYRWLGAQFGKVMHRVLTLGEAWRPLHPTHASLRGQTVRVRFHVPAPPLVWGRPFAGHRQVDVAERGFSVIDAEGSVPVVSVELTAPNEADLMLGRAPVGETLLRYADRRHGGIGCLHDSDTTLAEDTYEYNSQTGHYPSAAVEALVGRPYPLMNWCVAFSIPLVAG